MIKIEYKNRVDDDFEIYIYYLKKLIGIPEEIWRLWMEWIKLLN